MSGQGSFGTVSTAKYKPTGKIVVIKEPYNAGCYEKEFAKEIRLQWSVKGHPGIVECLGILQNPSAILQEYVSFSFASFKDEKVVTSLQEFLTHVDDYYDFEGFEHICSFMTTDILQGVAFLHEKGIVHRDVKPANILVSDHFPYDDARNFDAHFEANPLSCKLTDFGLSRSKIIQTQTMISSRVQSLDKGSPAFMSPEILLPENRILEVRHDDLKAADAWAVGMVLFNMINPDLKYPYAIEIEKQNPSQDNENQILQDLLRKSQTPATSNKYASHRNGRWAPIVSLSQQLTTFDKLTRLTNIDDALKIFQDLTGDVHHKHRDPQSTTIQRDTTTGIQRDTTTGIQRDTTTGIQRDTTTGIQRDTTTGEQHDTATSKDIVHTDIQFFHEEISSSPPASSGLYNGNPCLPVYSYTSKAYSWEQIIEIFLSEHDETDFCVSTPTLINSNVTFLIDTSKLKCVKDAKCDDMGSWSHTGTPKKLVILSSMNGESTIRGAKSKEEAKTDEEVLLLRRSYHRNRSSSDLKKIVSTVERGGSLNTLMFIQYLFDGDEHEIRVHSHGNSTRNITPYRRTLPSTMTQMKNTIQSAESPKYQLDQIYSQVGDVIRAESEGALPRGPQHLYDARVMARKETEMAPDAVPGPSGSVKLDAVYLLLERAKREEEDDGGSKFIRECSIHPSFSAVLADSQQLKQLAMFCTNPMEFSVFCIDPTFNIFEENLSLTVTTYRNLKLVNPRTGKSPVFLGPMFVHQRKDYKTYAKFFQSIITDCSDGLDDTLKCILAIGTDGEKALQDGCRRVFQFALFLRCFIHFKKGIEGNMSSRPWLTTAQKAMIIADILGRQDGEVFVEGLADCATADEFDQRLTSFKEQWNTMEMSLPEEKTFSKWFDTYQAKVMKDHMLKGLRIEAGLGNPPSQFTTNDVEAGNFIVKHGLKFEPRKPHEFINEIREIVALQYRNEQRALFHKGPYRLREGFTHLGGDSQDGMTAAQRSQKLNIYLNTGLEGRKTVLNEPQPLELETSSSLSVTPDSCGITAVPAPILDYMFNRAYELLQLDNHVMQKPGADESTFIVFGNRGQSYTVTRGKNGHLFNCDRNCTHRSTRICEHTIAVAEKCGVLKNFCTWYKSSRQGANLKSFAIDNGATNKAIGQKRNTRKRSNTTKPDITERISIADNVPPPSKLYHMPQLPTMARPTSLYPMPQMPTMLHSTPAHPMSYPLPQTQHQQLFSMKMVAGTTVSSCYGCHLAIQNPPSNWKEDFCVVYKDFRMFRHRDSGQMQVSSDLQNVHFHLTPQCVWSKYPTFISQNLVIPPGLIPLLSDNHKYLLISEFQISI